MELHIFWKHKLPGLYFFSERGGWNECSGPALLLSLKEDVVFCEVSLTVGDLGQVQI